MKKFVETVIKNGGEFFGVNENGKMTYEIQGLKSSPLIIFGDWISPEDHQAEIAKLNNKIDWLHGLLDERNEEVLQTVKLLNEAQPEIPESLAKIIEAHDLSVLGDWEKVVNLLSEDALTWLSQTDNVSAVLGKAATLCNLKIKGYTVAKEKRYVVEFLSDNYDRYILMQQGDEQPIIDIESNNDGFFKQEFTEQEIKDINEQYWAFAELVEE